MHLKKIWAQGLSKKQFNYRFTKINDKKLIKWTYFKEDDTSASNREITALIKVTHLKEIFKKQQGIGSG